MRITATEELHVESQSVSPCYLYMFSMLSRMCSFSITLPLGSAFIPAATAGIQRQHNNRM